MIVTIMLMIPVWYALLGGSGTWNDLDREANHGNLTRPEDRRETPSPGLLRVIDNRQHSFIDSLNQP